MPRTRKAKANIKTITRLKSDLICPKCRVNPARVVDFDGEQVVETCSRCSKARKRRNKRTLLGKKLLTLLSKRGVPTRFQSASMIDFSKDFRNIVKNDRVFLHGISGVGKTHLMSAMLRRDVLQGNYDSLMITMPELALQIRSVFNENKSEAEAIDPFTKVKNLYIDDLGTEKMSEWVAQLLFILIDSRYRNDLRTVISSNLDLRDIAEMKVRNSSGDWINVGNRISSRLSEMCEVIKIKGKDRRLK